MVMDVEWSAMPLLHLKRWQCPHRLTEHSLLAAQAFHPTSCSQHAFVPSMKSFLFPPFYRNSTQDNVLEWKVTPDMFRRAGRDSEEDLGFLFSVVLWNMDTKGGIRYFKGSQFTNML